MKKKTTSAVGILITLILAILLKWEPPFIRRNEVDTGLETVEHFTDVVERVAHDVGEWAGKVAEKLPEDTDLKEFLTTVENVADVVVDIIEQMEELEGKKEDEEENAKRAEHLRDSMGKLMKQAGEGSHHQLPQGGKTIAINDQPKQDTT